MMPGFDYEYPGDYVIEQPVRMANGGPTNPPIYVDSRNDQRYKMYQDSVYNYNTYARAINNINKNKSLKLLTDSDLKKLPGNIRDKVIYNKERFKENKNTDILYLPDYKNQYNVFDKSSYYQSAKGLLIHHNIDTSVSGGLLDAADLATQVFTLGNRNLNRPQKNVYMTPIYDKPEQPIIYRPKPAPTASVVNNSSITSTTTGIPIKKATTTPSTNPTFEKFKETLPEVVVKPPVDYSNSGLHYSIGVDKGKVVYRAGSIGNMKTMTPQQFEEFKKTDEFKKYNEVRKNDTPSLEQQLTVPQAGYIKMADGGFVPEQDNNILRVLNNNPSNNYYSSIAKSTIARENAFGNDAAKRMVKPTINPYDFGNGDFGTHYMSSMGNYAVPSIQKGADGNLFMNENASPYDKEAIRFNNDDEAEWFAKNYKSISPAFKMMYGGTIKKKKY